MVPVRPDRAHHLDIERVDVDIFPEAGRILVFRGRHQVITEMHVQCLQASRDDARAAAMHAEYNDDFLNDDFLRRSASHIRVAGIG